MTALDAPTVQRPPTEQGPVRSAGVVVRQLARVEARRFATHPVLWVAVALGTWMFLADLLSLRFLLPREAIHVQYAAVPIGAAALLIAHLATTRPRRDAVTEVLAPAVHGEDARIQALLLAALTPGVVTAVLVAVLLGGMTLLGAAGPVPRAEAATAPALVAAAGMLGVLLGRVAPWRLTPLIALVAVITAQLFVFDGGAGSSLSLREMLGPMVTPAMGLADPSALVRPAGLHLLYVVGVAGVLATVAVLLGRTSPRRVTAFVAALALTATAGVAQLRAPSDGEVDALLARVSTPEEAGECVDDGTGATVCALPMSLAWREGWAEVVRDVRAPLIERGVDPGPLTVAQRADPGAAAYDLSRWIDRREVDADPRMETAWEREYVDLPSTVLLTSEWLRGSDAADPSELDLALHVARNATGLPGGYQVVREEDGALTSAQVCGSAGQAREAITLWLGARSDAAAEGALREAVTDQPYPGGAGAVDQRRWIDLGTPSVITQQATWSHTGAAVALQLLDRPDEEVLAALTTNWERWTDPATSLRDLVTEFGLTMPPLADEVAAQLGDDDLAAEGLDQVLRDTPLPPLERGPDGVITVPDGASPDDGTIGCS